MPAGRRPGEPVRVRSGPSCVALLGSYGEGLIDAADVVGLVDDAVLLLMAVEVRCWLGEGRPVTALGSAVLVEALRRGVPFLRSIP